MIIYNLYPKLLGKMSNWIYRFDEIRNMGFDWIYINPISMPGFSGSDYSIKDYYLYNPIFLKDTPATDEDYADENSSKNRIQGNRMIKDVCMEAKKRGISMMLDLVISHTAIDSPLTKLKPEWYETDENGKIKNPGVYDNGKFIPWGDLAKINNLNSKDKFNLMDFWVDLIKHYCNLGFKGFRCDAAYQVPSKSWKYIIEAVKADYPETLFLGETLGCTVDELEDVASVGFDYIMNSFKWWDLKQDWFLKDYNKWADKYLSISFVENHDTERFAKEYNGDKDLAIFYYSLASLFSCGVKLTLGFEYGFTKKIDVVKTNPSDYEKNSYDIRKQVSDINYLKKSKRILNEDNIINRFGNFAEDIFAYYKNSRDSKSRIMIIANSSKTNEHKVNFDEIAEIMGESIKDISLNLRLASINKNTSCVLQPLEIKIFYSEL